MEIQTCSKSEQALNSSPASPLMRRQFDEQLFMSKQNSLKVDPLGKDERYLQSLNQLKQRGRIELIMGPMFAGKSTELLRRVKRLEISGKKCLSIKYGADERYSKDCISTHDQQQRTAVSCKVLSQIQQYWMEFDVLGIDEGQFFEDVVEFSEIAANAGKIVIMSALNGTYEKKGWANILELIPLCEKVKKLSAICKICATNANYTFRTCAGSSQEMIGGADMYMPLCRECFNEKTKQQNMAKMILHSESKSVSTDDGMTPENQLIDMRQLNLSSNGKTNSNTANSPPANSSVEPKNQMDRKHKVQAKKSETVVLDYNTGFEEAENESLRK